MADAMIVEAPQDAALTAAATQALMNYPGVRVWTDALVLTTTNGVVQVKGHVRTQAEKEVTEDVILKTNGVKDVIAELYVDTDLEIAVGKALGDDPRTRGDFPGILVGSAFGDLYLKGSVTSADTKKAAEEIAGRVPGVIAVYNQLEVSSAAKPAAAAKPAVGVAKPAVGAVKPAAAGEKPAAVKPPAAVGGKPVTPVKPPATVGGKPVVAVKPPATVGGKPVVPVKRPAASGNITPVKPPTTVGGRPVVAVKKSTSQPAAEPESKPEVKAEGDAAQESESQAKPGEE
ncbi:MAG: BON domain-containing protein [Anaerolineae bacterium]|nr:BON domain-containing protein [Anaerolineae bacterium]